MTARMPVVGWFLMHSKKSPSSWLSFTAQSYICAAQCALAFVFVLLVV
jgi:hypothetical protein